MGSGSSTKSDSAHRIEVVRGPRRTLIRLTGSFLVLLTPPPSHSLLGALLLSVRRPRFLPLPIRENVRATNIYIYWKRLRFDRPRAFFFSLGYFVAAERLDPFQFVCIKEHPPVSTAGKLFIRLSVKYGSP